MDKNNISNHLYNDSIPQAIKFVNSINDEESLFIYAFNYNWDNGFEIPNAILNNNNCSLSIALLIFNAADGYLYLQERETDSGTKTWFSFVSNLYNRIINDNFYRGTSSFKPQLSRVQEYKLKKVLNEKELIFITPIEGHDFYKSL
ncbi:MAG: DUF4274 domain-containing protein [Lachnospiraceae bacterium]|nr:DUF4274 domain-containing protein [Lachnospiraceae bacterium]